MSGIKLSEKHGLNLSMIVCPKCDKDMGIAMLGKLPKDEKAPMHIPSTELCDECKKDFIILICEGYLAGFINRQGVDESLRDNDILQITKEDLATLKEGENENNKK